MCVLRYCLLGVYLGYVVRVLCGLCVCDIRVLCGRCVHTCGIRVLCGRCVHSVVLGYCVTYVCMCGVRVTNIVDMDVAYT